MPHFFPTCCKVAFGLIVLALGCSAWAGDPVLLAYSITDQTASFRLEDGSIVLAEPGKPFQTSDHLTLERILNDRIVLTRQDPRAAHQIERLWIDVSRGLDEATFQTFANIPDKLPPSVRFEPPVLIQTEGSEPILTQPPASAKPKN